MRGLPLLCVLVLTLTPPAAAAPAQRVHGEVDLPSGLHAKGEGVFSDPGAVLELTPAVLAGQRVSLSWAHAEGHRVENTWRRYDTPADPVSLGGKSRNDSLGIASGVLESLQCGSEACRVVVFGLGGEGTSVGLAGRMDGPLRRLDEPRRHWAEMTASAEDAFYHETPAGAFAAGADEDAALLFDAAPAARGAVGLLLVDALAVIRTPEGSETLDAVHRIQPVQGPGGVTLGRDEHTSFVYLRLRDASLSMAPGGRVVFLSESPVLSLDGDASATRASGVLVVDGVAHRFEGTSLRLEGAMDLALGPSSKDLPVLGGSRGAHAEVDGELRAVRIGSQRVVGAPGVDVVATGLGVAALAGAAWLVLSRAPWLPFYSRLQSSSVLGNPRRQEIHALLKSRPGLTATEVAAAMGLARVVVQHHLRMLETHRFVSTRREGRRRVYFLAGDVPAAPLLHGQVALRDDTRRRIAEAIVGSDAPLTQAALVERVGVSQRLVSYHLSHLQESGLVSAEGKLPRVYRPTPLLGEALRAAR